MPRSATREPHSRNSNRRLAFRQNHHSVRRWRWQRRRLRYSAHIRAYFWNGVRAKSHLDRTCEVVAVTRRRKNLANRLRGEGSGLRGRGEENEEKTKTTGGGGGGETNSRRYGGKRAATAAAVRSSTRLSVSPGCVRRSTKSFVIWATGDCSSRQTKKRRTAKRRRGGRFLFAFCRAETKSAYPAPTRCSFAASPVSTVDVDTFHPSSYSSRLASPPPTPPFAVCSTRSFARTRTDEWPQTRASHAGVARESADEAVGVDARAAHRTKERRRDVECGLPASRVSVRCGRDQDRIAANGCTVVTALLATYSYSRTRIWAANRLKMREFRSQPELHARLRGQFADTRDDRTKICP